MLNRKEIDEKIMDYVNTKKPQLGRFYLLLKIHKRRSNVPGRPTMVFSLRIFHRSSISTIIPTIPHILEDAKDFVSRLNQLCDIPDNT